MKSDDKRVDSKILFSLLESTPSFMWRNRLFWNESQLYRRHVTTPPGEHKFQVLFSPSCHIRCIYGMEVGYACHSGLIKEPALRNQSDGERWCSCLWSLRARDHNQENRSSAMMASLGHPGSASGPMLVLAAKTKTKKKHFVQQKLKVFRASDPVLSVFIWGVNHSVGAALSYQLPQKLTPFLSVEQLALPFLPVFSRELRSEL